jgi:hypothetical protein
MTLSRRTNKSIARQIALGSTCGAVLGLLAGAVTLRLLPLLAGNRILAGLVFAGLAGLGIVLGAAWGSRATRGHPFGSAAPPDAPKRPRDGGFRTRTRPPPAPDRPYFIP